MLLDKGADIERENKHGKKMGELASDANRLIVLDALDRVNKSQQSEYVDRST